MIKHLSKLEKKIVNGKGTCVCNPNPFSDPNVNLESIRISLSSRDVCQFYCCFELNDRLPIDTFQWENDNPVLCDEMARSRLRVN